MKDTNSIEISKEQMDKVYEAIRCAYNLSIADIQKNDSTCCCFNIEPFNTNWDIKTTEDIRDSVHRYVKSWILEPLLFAFNIDNNNVCDKIKLLKLKQQVRELEYKINQNN